MQLLEKQEYIRIFCSRKHCENWSFLGWNTLQKIMGMQWISLHCGGLEKPWENKGWNTIFQVRQIRRKSIDIILSYSSRFFQILLDSCHILPYSCRFFHILSDSSIFFQILHILSDSSIFFQILPDSFRLSFLKALNFWCFPFLSRIALIIFMFQVNLNF